MPVENEHREISVQEQYLDEHGWEKPNPTPLQPPIGYVKHPTIQETMRAMISQASYEAAMSGQETEDEANDFDAGPDGFEHEFPSRYTHEFERDPIMENMIALRSKAPAPPKDKGPPAQAAPATPPAPTPAEK